MDGFDIIMVILFDKKKSGMQITSIYAPKELLPILIVFHFVSFFTFAEIISSKSAFNPKNLWRII